MQASSSFHSAVSAVFFNPLLAPLDAASSRFLCHALPDLDWLQCGVRRCLSLCQSGRDFLQQLAQTRGLSVGLNTFFESLKSSRRHALCCQINAGLLAQLSRSVPDPFASLDGSDALRDFELYAGDGHFHAAACHDPSFACPQSEPLEGLARVQQKRRFPVAHFYALNLRTQGLSHLSVADQITRNKEHDMHALKRLSIAALRQGAGKGRKVLYVWDKAGIDLRQWFHWKQSGIYFLSRQKENMSQQIMALHAWDALAPINAGVVADEMMATSQGVAVRRVSYRDAASQRVFVFLTNLAPSVPPGMVALLYQRRWDLEKVFDEIKNKLAENKAWGSSATAKTNQAGLICLTHNLLTLLERHMDTQEDIRNEAEVKRKAKRLLQTKEQWLRQGKSLAEAPQAFQRLTVRTVKFIRWVRHGLDSTASWHQSLTSLRRVYASL